MLLMTYASLVSQGWQDHPRELQIFCLSVSILVSSTDYYFSLWDTYIIFSFKYYSLWSGP